MISRVVVGLLGCLPLLMAAPAPKSASAPASATRLEVEEVMELGKVPADFPVRFCLMSAGERQYVAYYDAEHRMVVAMRRLDEKAWQRKVLPTQVGCDSHNYITMAVDAQGCIHVAGNMHVVPLIYFRTTKPWDISTLEAASMTGKLEDKVTYPRFLKDADERLIFNYRHGSSGDGVEIWNVLDAKGKWQRLLDTPLLDGEGRTNAYPSNPVRGPDGFYHMIWVWRETPDCASNHHLCHARSKNLIDWESVFGQKLKLPILEGSKETWVDPAPPGSGMINGGARLVFDRNKQPILIYHKSDEAGHMQIFAARPGDGVWKTQALTQWQEKIEFSGPGSMDFIGISLSAVRVVDPGVIVIDCNHRGHGRVRLQVDEQTLQPVTTKVAVPSTIAPTMQKVESTFPGMGIQRSEDIGQHPQPGVRYILQWETLPPNRDKPRTPPLPEPSMLRLYKLRGAN